MPRNRNQQLSIRLSEKEISLFERKRAATGLSKTEFLLKLLKSAKIQVFQFSDTIKTLHGELRKIGVNLNQIAYLVNIGHDERAFITSDTSRISNKNILPSSDIRLMNVPGFSITEAARSSIFLHSARSYVTSCGELV